MKTVIWRPGLNLPHDPNAVEDYRIDWADWLGVATLAIVNVQAAEGIIAEEIIAARTAATCDVRIQGGTARIIYAVQIRVEASDGRKRDRTVLFTCREE